MPEDKKKVLVVDDNPEIRMIFRDVLKRSGYDVLEAGSAVDAAFAVKTAETQISYTLMDYYMPNGNGSDLLKNLREQKLIDRAGLIIPFTAGPALEVVTNLSSSELRYNKVYTPYDLISSLIQRTNLDDLYKGLF